MTLNLLGPTQSNYIRKATLSWAINSAASSTLALGLGFGDSGLGAEPLDLRTWSLELKLYLASRDLITSSPKCTSTPRPKAGGLGIGESLCPVKLDYSSIRAGLSHLGP